MIPEALATAADAGLWKLVLGRKARDGATWLTLAQPDTGLMIDIRRDRWRHTTARAYRGSALTALFSNQRDIATYLEAA